MYSPPCVLKRYRKSDAEGVIHGAQRRQRDRKLMLTQQDVINQWGVFKGVFIKFSSFERINFYSFTNN